MKAKIIVAVVLLLFIILMPTVALALYFAI